MTVQQIDAAIKSGAIWLIAQQNADGSFGKWGLGSTCLAVMALLYSNALYTTAAVKRAVTYILNSAPPDDTYFRALAVMALTSYGKKTPEILHRVQADTDWLLRAQGTNADDMLSYGGWGGSHQPQLADGSNTQYAIAALAAAASWEITVPQATWQRAVTWYQRNHDANNNGCYVHSLGDSSQSNNNGVTYSMTAAALASLKIINLLANTREVQAQAGNLLTAALNWLNTNYVVNLSASIPDSWYYYYLYSLASGCVIEPEFTVLGTYDWYNDMADILVMLQKPDGKWASELDKKSTEVVHTSFALLALNKAAPVMTANVLQHAKMDTKSSRSCACCRDKCSNMAKEQQRKRRIDKAQFPIIKTLESFDFSNLPRPERALIRQLGECHFVAKKEKIVFIGNPGTGKTHLAIALGLKACDQGYKVRFYTAAQLVNTLLTAQIRRKYANLAQQLSKIDVLIIDELSYLTLPRPGAELLFQVISARDERASLIITTNLEFSQWTELFGDPMLTAAVVDRMNYNSHIIDTHGPSYRLRHSYLLTGLNK